jgi:hypothetical protein
VHLRVDDTDGPIHPNSAKSLSLGQAMAWQTSSSVNAKEGEIRNLKTVFTFEHDGQTYVDRSLWYHWHRKGEARSMCTKTS